MKDRKAIFGRCFCQARRLFQARRRVEAPLLLALWRRRKCLLFLPSPRYRKPRIITVKEFELLKQMSFLHQALRYSLWG